MREKGPDRVRHGTARLRLPLHLLHRALHARPGAQPPPGRRRARGRGAGGGRAPPRSRCSGRRSTATTTASTTSPTCSAPSARWTGFAGCGSPARIPPTSRRGSSRRWPTTPAVCEHVHLPVQSGSNAVLRRMLRRYTRERYLEVVERAPAAIPGITFSTDIIVGFPGETEAAVRGDAEPRAPMPISTTPTRSSTRSARARRRCACATTSPDDVASERLERLIEAVRAKARRKNVARVGERARGAGGAAGPAGRSHAGPHPDQSSGSARSPGRRRRATTTTCRLTGTTGPPSPARCVTPGTGGPVIHNLAEEHVLAAYESLRPQFPRFLRLRCLPGGCAGLRAEPGPAPLRLQPAGLGRHRGQPGKGAEPGGHRCGHDGRAAEDLGGAALRRPGRRAPG